MNTKLTIRLIAYSLIAVWSIWLIGRPGEIDPESVDTAAIATQREHGQARNSAQNELLLPGADAPSDSAAIDSTGNPLPVVEAEQAKIVRLYIDRMVSTEASINRLMDYARQSPDDPAWSAPIRSAINEVIRVTEREAFESGTLFVECGGLLCFIHGNLNIDTTLTQLPLALWAASNRNEIRFATARSQKSERHGWVFFVAAPDFAAPPNR